MPLNPAAIRILATCDACGGTGKVKVADSARIGVLTPPTVMANCGACHGSGKVLHPTKRPTA